MLQVDLSTLRHQELRQLLDTARQRGQASLSYEILQEMAARRERGGQPSSRPRVVGLDLGDSLDDAALYDDPAPSGGEPHADLPAEPDDAAPLRLDREPARAPRRSRAAARPPRAARPARAEGVWGRRIRWGMAGLVAGVAAGYVFGFWVGTEGMTAAPAPVAMTAKPAPVMPVAVAAPPPAEPPPAEPAADALGPATVRPPTETTPAPPAPTAQAAPEPTPDVPEAAPDADPPKTKPVGKVCAGETPADRAICGDPRLQRLQRELRAAYAEALDAHEDRDLLRERQLAWRDARDAVADPDRLARLYEERIRKLKAATAEARSAR